MNIVLIASDDRIVSITQPHVRPIVRGQAGNPPVKVRQKDVLFLVASCLNFLILPKLALPLLSWYCVPLLVRIVFSESSNRETEKIIN